MHIKGISRSAVTRMVSMPARKLHAMTTRPRLARTVIGSKKGLRARRGLRKLTIRIRGLENGLHPNYRLPLRSFEAHEVVHMTNISEDDSLVTPRSWSSKLRRFLRAIWAAVRELVAP